MPKPVSCDVTMPKPVSCDVTMPKPVSCDVTMPKPGVTWRPRGCQGRYATLYTFTDYEEEKEPEVEQSRAVDASTSTERQNPWCAGCLRPSVESFQFSCGHNFCKRCIAETQDILVREFWDSVRDVRATIRCPVGKCRATLASLPLVNGGFRFHEHRPLPEVTLPEIPSTRDVVQEAPSGPRRSDDLFLGFNDVIDRTLTSRRGPASKYETVFY